MSGDAIDILRLNEDLLKARVNFLTSYIKSEEEQDEQRTWEHIGKIGTAFLHAAQSAWFFDEKLSADLTRQAAYKFINIGLPYGLYLLSLSVNDYELKEALNKKWVSSILNKISDPAKEIDINQEEQSISKYAWSYPSQKVYFLCALLGHYSFASDYSRVISSILEELNPFANHLIGPHGTPLKEYLNVVHSTYQIYHSTGDISRNLIDSALNSILNINHRYVYALENGMESKYLWDHLFSPVELIDFEVSGLFLRIFEASNEYDINITDFFDLPLEGMPAISFKVSESLKYWRHRNNNSNNSFR